VIDNTPAHTLSDVPKNGAIILAPRSSAAITDPPSMKAMMKSRVRSELVMLGILAGAAGCGLFLLTDGKLSPRH
jgi:hypothetical protein